ncbi:EF-Tu/IF-2/RF-3 family GTPase, partial [Acinetobacter baumannii]
QAQMMQARPRDGLFRLAVDRVFTLPGQGTVVTGTVFNGQVRVGDTLAHSASGQAVRVRSIHAQNQSSDSGVAGQRCALNLAGIGKDEIERGDWI